MLNFFLDSLTSLKAQSGTPMLHQGVQNLDDPDQLEDDSPDSEDNVANIQLVIRNPESNVFLGVAYWYYHNSQFNLATGQVCNT